jgi:hypothetical protein
MKRRATLVIISLDFVLWAAFAVALLFFSSSEMASSGSGILSAVVVTLLFALTALPAYLLVRAQRESTLALVFALAFPIVFLFLFAFVTTLMI